MNGVCLSWQVPLLAVAAAVAVRLGALRVIVILLAFVIATFALPLAITAQCLARLAPYRRSHSVARLRVRVARALAWMITVAADCSTLAAVAAVALGVIALLGDHTIRLLMALVEIAERPPAQRHSTGWIECPTSVEMLDCVASHLPEVALSRSVSGEELGDTLERIAVEARSGAPEHRLVRMYLRAILVAIANTQRARIARALAPRQAK